jgi:hypothetical protein
MSQSPFVMVGTVEAEVCIDGVCVVPNAAVEITEES